MIEVKECNRKKCHQGSVKEVNDSCVFSVVAARLQHGAQLPAQRGRQRRRHRVADLPVLRVHVAVELERVREALQQQWTGMSAVRVQSRAGSRNTCGLECSTSCGELRYLEMIVLHLGARALADGDDAVLVGVEHLAHLEGHDTIGSYWLHSDFGR